VAGLAHSRRELRIRWLWKAAERESLNTKAND
jgi:hypothetical protein